MLGFELRKTGSPHNCLDDACTAMKLVLAKVEGGVDNIIPLVREEVMSKSFYYKFHLLSCFPVDKMVIYSFEFRCKRPRRQSYLSTEYQQLFIVKSCTKLFLETLLWKSRLGEFMLFSFILC